VKRMRSPASGALRSRAFGFCTLDRADPGLDRANRIMRGRRSKTSKEGNRESEGRLSAARAMGI